MRDTEFRNYAVLFTNISNFENRQKFNLLF